MATDYKQIIIDSLDILRKRDIVDKSPFGARAYAKVISELKNYSGIITKYEDVQEMNGIGEKIQKKIKEILETGVLASAEKVKELYNIDALVALDTFQNIYGVGPAKATELINIGYTSVIELRDALKQNPKILNDKQKIGLKYYEDLLERIPRNEMEEHYDILKSLLPNEMEKYEIEIVGSFRRNALNSGDIDVLIHIPNGEDSNIAKYNFELYVKMLEGCGYIEEILALGKHKCMAISRMYEGKSRRLDILLTPDNEYVCALLYFTGSDRFNVAFRQYALDRGYTLNEHKLTAIRQGVQVVPYMKTEKDIFKFLGLRYIEPSMRVDANQIISVRSRPTIALN